MARSGKRRRRSDFDGESDSDERFESDSSNNSVSDMDMEIDSDLDEFGAPRRRHKQRQKDVSFVRASAEVSQKDIHEEVSQKEIHKEIPQRMTLGSGSDPAAQFANSFAKNKSKSAPSGFGSFEKHTKGFGSRMLARMGYVSGHGLGADGRGIVAPVAVKLRPTGMGLGHGGFEERTEAQKASGSADPPHNPPKKETSDGWRKSTLRKPIRRFKTAAELIDAAEKNSSEKNSENATKIVDMTGAAPIVLSHPSQIVSAKIVAGRLPELRHNTNLLATTSQSELLVSARRIKSETARRDASKVACDALSDRMHQNNLRLNRLKNIQNLVVEISRKASAVSASSFDAPEQLAIAIEAATCDVFDKLKSNYSAECATFALDNIVVAIFMPIFKKIVLDWNPLEAPQHAADLVCRWRKLVPANPSIDSETKNDMNSHSSATHFADSKTMSPIDTMLYTVWLPRVRQAINNDWDVHKPEPIIDLFSAWCGASETADLLQNHKNQSILPKWMFDNIVHQLILPKLNKAVDEMDLRTNALSSAAAKPFPHTWLHPWLPVLPEPLLSPLWTTVRRKMEQAWRDWRPFSKPDTISPLRILKPWIPVFSSDDFSHLLATCVLPALVTHLRTALDISPASEQDLRPLTDDVFPWADLIPEHVFSHLLATEFFSRWLDTLWIWVTSPGADLDQVTDWYLGWKRFFEAAGFSHLESVKHAWRTALDMMNQALALRESGDASVPKQPIYAPMYEQPQPTHAFKNEKKPSSMLSSTVTTTLSFKDYVEAVAAENNISFVPLHRSHAGTDKPLYKLGHLVVYIDQGVLFVASNAAENRSGVREWIPVSIEDAMSRVMQS